MNDHNPILYYAPRTRASGVLTLLEELDVPYELRVLNFQLGEQRKPEYLAVNPLGKVPAIIHNGALVTELGAIFIYLADAFPQKGLAPAIGDALRGPYLRWLVFYGSAFEPAIVDRSMKREPAPASRSPYGDFDGVMALINAQLTQGPYLFGERFTAADILWGGALRWTVGFGLVPESAHISAYIERVTSRPCFARVAQTDEELLKIHEAAAGSR
ncbi:glutathione S-transferase family protein [Methylocystis sp. L43]|jgi:glutathione S-transferase|uniref:glutathione S-transferase family protein n=1 Tax=unclassified Methylocystis TaxID=2625913 RepID=UPI0018C2382F|nr:MULTISPECIES: glutathione S-transferase family protein [unclassified Methylocystis]MBG0798886.1 glutathione S-transferase family protein [Methylocystis sp. L43]MBG0806393.1 glutathione S-transferase family protein [Methylocystis sp. H15]